MADVKPLTRNQIAAFVGTDQEAIRAIEKLFAVAGQSIPDEVADLVIKVAYLLEQATDQEYISGVINDIVLSLLQNSLKLDYIDLNPAPPHVSRIRRLAWSESEQVPEVGLDYGVVQQIGLEYYARVQNSTGSTIPNGTFVGFTGVGSNNVISVAPYLANGSSPSLYGLGVMTHALPNSGQVGYCTTWGHIRGINTSTFSVGDILYASPTVAGGLTNVKPTAPSNVIPVAAVLFVSATVGEIFVRPTIQQMQYYAVIQKTTDQSPAAINTAYPLTMDSIQIGNGVTIGTPSSRVIVPQSGLYKFDAKLQLTSSSSSQKNIWVWFRKNGTDVANSARVVTMNINGGYIPIAISETISMAANDYVEVVFASDNTAVSVDNIPSTAFAPASPSILLAVTQVQQ
jgi:hypothetical protein